MNVKIKDKDENYLRTRKFLIYDFSSFLASSLYNLGLSFLLKTIDGH